MRWGINEVETQEGGSRWLERRLCCGGERRWGRATQGRRPGGARRWQEERASGPSGEGAGGQEAGTSLGGCMGPYLLCFKLEAMQTPHGHGHSEVPGIVGALLWKFQGMAASLIKT